ncbi:hypothetical protein EV384_1546 [Micromonospora kangleipakensis]|uniref:Tetracyclin repressor-like C-terminal domain-containing protein n=1 Tax=Micromonospora kangleipakensis TaxID=1077942 RepID=A0A4Q8B6B9_9ACTN|nr:hypothetical protein [Micromonospora kangleipakensis]RZU73147.1 hypothetical protein EV384_1546 [Micromonospora kangleipakensis]
MPLPAEETAADDPSDLTEQLLSSLGAKMASEPTELIAMLRSMLTRPNAAREVRAGLVGAVTIGAVIGRYLLQLDGVRDAPPERIVDLLRPCLRSLMDEADRA